MEEMEVKEMLNMKRRHMPRNRLKKPRNYWITMVMRGVEILVPMDDQDSYVLDEDAVKCCMVRVTKK